MRKVVLDSRVTAIYIMTLTGLGWTQIGWKALGRLLLALLGFRTGTTLTAIHYMGVTKNCYEIVKSVRSQEGVPEWASVRSW